MSAPCDLGLVEAADAVASGAVTASALLESCLARMDAANAALNATIWVDRDGARQAAAAADAARAAGKKLGRLHGVPLAHKDMYYQAGKPCTCGSAIRRDFVPDYTCTVVGRLAAAGAFSFAGLNMAEFAQNPTGHNRAFGHCHNPWNPPYITGGSSSGSGAAVAARITFASLGSDTGGSIRLPASACGVTGIKPTQTRVSRYGVMPLSFSTDNVGPLARSARDCARMLSVIAGHDPLDPTSADEAVPDYEAALDGDLRGQRIGVPRNALQAQDPAVQAAIDAALAVHARWMRERAQDYAVYISARMFAAYAIPGTYYVEALAQRGPVLKAFAADVFSKVDVIATPTIPTALPTLAETDIDAIPPGGPFDAIARFLAVSVNTRPFNYLGLPAISVPCGFDANGLPVGLQLAGRPFAEARLFKLGDALQRDTDWHGRKPGK
jgi:aspartyl-tRNA(Asn)/glutamyl-tRNA(Gln) amidotransferase subunit A